MSLEILLRRAAGNRIAAHHLAGEGRIREFLSQDPASPDAFARRAEDVRRRFPDRAAVLRALLRPASTQGRKQLERVAEGGGYVVTTGHQAGLFGGPLMGVYKLLSAVRLARDLEDTLDAPVAPVYWVASDDHDWDEARRTWLLDTANDLVELALPADGPGDPTPPMSRRALGAAVTGALAELESALPVTDFSPPLLAAVRDAYAPDATAAGAFEALLGHVAGALGVLFVDPAAPAMRRAAEPILRAEVDAAARHEEVLRERTQALEDAGYHSQIPLLEGGTNLHIEGPAGRERLFREGSGFRLRASGTTLDAEAVRAAAAESGTLTAGVGLRPVLESAILPTLAYVGGAAEVAYFAQIEPLFAEHDLAPAVVVPRYSVTLVEAKVRKVLDRFGLEPADFDRPAHEIGARVLREELPQDVTGALQALRGALGEGYARLTETAREIDPTLAGAIASARNSALKDTQDLEKRIAQHADDRREIGLQQLRKAEINLFPRGRAQERVLNPLQYLARYGPALLRDVLDAMGSLVDAPAAH